MDKPARLDKMHSDRLCDGLGFMLSFTKLKLRVEDGKRDGVASWEDATKVAPAADPCRASDYCFYTTTHLL